MSDVLDAGGRPRGSASHSEGRAKAALADRLLQFAIWVTIGGQVWNSILGTPSVAMIGTYNLTVAEVSLAAGGLAVAAGWLTYGLHRNLMTLIVLTFAILAAINLMRGLVETPASALVVARATLPFPALLLLCTVRYHARSLTEPLQNALTAAAFILILIVFSRVALGPQFLMLGGIDRSVLDINDGGRALPAGGALLLAVAAVVNLARAMHQATPSIRHSTLTILTLVALTLTGQGTATIAALVGILIVTALEGGQLRALRWLVSGAVIFLGGSLLFIVEGFSLSDLNGVLPSHLIENLERREANLSTRELVWQGAWNAYLQAPTLTKLVGWPTGASPYILLQTRSWGWVTWTASVHSMYFGTLLATGAAGAGLYITMLSGAIRLSILEVTRHGTALPLAAIAMLVVFGYTYSLPTEQALVLASALAVRLRQVGGQTRSKMARLLPLTCSRKTGPV